ncbi:MAG: hypothetical protein GWN13_24750 [Phycisphaerae bacterium]|nr:hypothetical protein [Phycisphaerae bacterium]
MRYFIIILLLATAGYAALGTIGAFNGGEWSQKLLGRQDLRRYYTACQTCENVVPIITGPAQKRPGTYYINTTNGLGRLISFEHSTDQAYVLEFSEKIMRVYK